MRFLFTLMLIGAILPLTAATQTWSNVPLIDQNCSAKFTVKDADTHTRSCALSCASSGYGILTSDGTFLKFDSDGSKKALAALKATKKQDHLRATVSGELKDGAIKVESFRLD